MRSPVARPFWSRSWSGSICEQPGQLVHLGFVGKADLDRAEAAHGATRRMVGSHDIAVDDGRRGPGTDRPRSTPRWRSPPYSTRRTRRRRAPAAPRPSPARRRWLAWWRYHIRAGWRCTCPRKDSSREKSILTGRPVLSASKQTWICRLMSSRAPNAPPTPARVRCTCLRRQTKTRWRSGRDRHAATGSRLTGRPAVVGRAGQAGLGAQKRLVLHADLVGALDDDVAGDGRVAVADARGEAEHVAVPGGSAVRRGSLGSSSGSSAS